MISNNKKFFENSDTLLSLFTEMRNDLLVITQPDSDFKIQFIGDGIFLKKLGYSRNSIEETSFLNLLYPDDVEKTVNFLKNNVKSKTQTREIRIKSKKDNFIWVEIVAKKFSCVSTGEQILIHIRDLSRQKEIENKLKETEQEFETITERYRNLFENMFIGFAYHKIIVNKDNEPIDYKFLEANPAFEKITGLKVNEIIGKTVKELLPGIESDPTDWIGKYGKVAIYGIPITFESYAAPLDQWYNITAYSPKRGYFAVIFTNITKHKKAEHELKESENKFRTLFDNAGDSIVIHDLDGNIFEVNKTTCEQLGYSREELLTMTPMDFVTPEYAVVVLDRIEELKQKGSAFYESATISKNGNIIPVEISAKIIDYKDQKAILSVVRDITERKRAEEKLKESEKKFRSLFESSLYFIGLLDTKRILVDCNDTANKFFSKHKKEDLIGKNIKEILTLNEENKHLIPLFEQQFSEIINGKGIKSFDFKLNRSKGDFLWLHLEASLIEIGNKKLIQVIIQDITEKKLAEKKLEESEEKFRTITEQSLMGIVIVQDNRIKYINKQLADTLGYSPEEFKSWEEFGFAKLIHPNDKGRVLDQIREKQLGPPDVTAQYQFRGLSKAGEIIWFEIYSKSINYKGSVADLITAVDITEQKFAEDKLLESEEKYRLISENANDMIVVLNDKFEYEYLNENMHERLLGYSKDELLGKTQLPLIHPDDRKQTIIATSQILRKGKGSHQVRFLHKNGSYKWLEITGKIFYDSKGDKKILTISRDITERKKVAKKLEESEEKYRSLFENMNAGFAYHEVIVDDENKPIDYKYIEVNPAFEKLTSLKKEDLIGKTVTQVLPGIENDPADWIGKFGNVGLTGIPLNIEDYSEPIKKWYQVSGYSPKKGFFAVTFTDITDQKEAESRIRESEAKYHDLFETSPNGVILADLEGNIIECNSALENITGYPIEKFIGKNVMDLDIYHENGLKTLLEGFKDLLGEKKLEYIEFPIKRSDNQISWVQIRSTFVKRKEESFILSVVNDISTQKTAKEALKESEEKYRELLESASVGIMEIDLVNGQLSFINPRLLDIIGYEREELTGVTMRDKLIHPKDLSKLRSSNEELDIEFRIIDKYGKQKWLAGKKTPHFDENGNKISLRFWLDDITEKKMYEELIFELNINFLNFTADIRNNIELLLKTGLKLLCGDLILYAHKSKLDMQESYQLITSDNESFVYSPKDFFENLFISEIFNEEHDFPQSYFDIDKKKYASTDPFIKKNEIKGCFGKIIRSQEGLESVVCVYYKENPIITDQYKLVMFLICDAIEIEQRRWQVQQDLEKQNITLNKMNHLKKELFSRTSHELKTPLISIKGFTELLLTLHKSKLDTEMISILEEIKGGSKRLEKIINLLLESTKLEAEQLELNLKTEDLTFLIRFCVKELKGLATLRNQMVSINLHDELKTKFDKERIYEVISNLLLNSIKYTPPGGVISIISEVNDKFYIISIIDNGIGFTEEEKSQVFKQFGKIERYGQGWDVAIEGTGLGLYITKKLVELHGGKIWLESEGRNKGSTFKFSLPRKK
jgi:PAS domain S-box-containing protein